jgi:hypothetical protein
MLSEKAKGKQRAIESLSFPEPGNSAATSVTPQPLTRDLVIRFTEGVPDLTVSVEERDTVKDVKRKASSQRRTLHTLKN